MIEKLKQFICGLTFHVWDNITEYDDAGSPASFEVEKCKDCGKRKSA